VGRETRAEVVTPRVVFDCMVFVQAAARPNGPAAACVARAEAGEIELVVSAETLDELRDVLNRPKVQKGFRTLTPAVVGAFLSRVERFATTVAPVPETVALARDPKDSKYLNLALAGGAELIVSRDNDLLDLMTSDAAEPVAFRAAHPQLKVLDPVAFLNALVPPAPSPTATDEAP
jgi:putative PIN family toxin of toxin-antitoxin system